MGAELLESIPVFSMRPKAIQVEVRFRNLTSARLEVDSYLEMEARPSLPFTSPISRGVRPELSQPATGAGAQAVFASSVFMRSRIM
jgi:hypothetical protein